jgi:flagellar protein FlaG
MDTGLSIRPIAGATETGPVRPDPGVAVATTELARAKSVTASKNATATAAHDGGRNAVRQTSASPQTRPDIIIDAQSREVIYRVIDIRSGRVERQVPEEALLRMKAYARALESGKSVLEADAHGDWQA